MDGLNNGLAGRSPMAKSPWAWDEMLVAFRALGGIAENVTVGNGPLGRGIFPIDRAKPINLHVPPNLLFPVDAIEFSGSKIRIKDSAKAAAPERDFFEKYQEAFSWGGGGHTDCAAFIAELDSLPPDVRTQLVSVFRMNDFFQGDRVERAQKWFLQSRIVEFNKENVVMPVIELINHGAAGLPYQTIEGIRVKGQSPDEVLASYFLMDPIGGFRTWGFASPEPGAFSLPVVVKSGRHTLIVASNASLHDKRGSFWTPKLKADGDSLVLSHMMIGHAKLPRLSRGTFSTLMKEAGLANIDETFDQIVHFNRMKFLELLAALEPVGGGMAVTLRKTARYQLEAMSHCIGTREL